MELLWWRVRRSTIHASNLPPQPRYFLDKNLQRNTLVLRLDWSTAVLSFMWNSLCTYCSPPLQWLKRDVTCRETIDCAASQTFCFRSDLAMFTLWRKVSCHSIIFTSNIWRGILVTRNALYCVPYLFHTNFELIHQKRNISKNIKKTVRACWAVAKFLTQHSRKLPKFSNKT